MENSIYAVVFSNQQFHYDDCGRSYLPEFKPIFGLYEDIGDAHRDIYNRFYECDFEKYEEINSNTSSNGDETYIFKYEDKKYGGYAIYTVQLCEKQITPKRESPR